AQKEPNNPEAFYTISTYYWDKAYRDFKLKENEKKDFVEKGVEAVDHALQIKPDYMEALVYKNLLLRLQANLEKDQGKQQQLIKDADRLRDKANELPTQTAAGVSWPFLSEPLDPKGRRAPLDGLFAFRLQRQPSAWVK